VVHLLEFGHFNLLALDKSILTIANYSRNWKLDQNPSTWFTDGAGQNLSGTLHPLVFIVSEDYLSWIVTGVWTLDISFGDVDE